MSAPTVSASGNTATVTFPSEAIVYRNFTLTSHTTKSQQIVSIKVDDESAKEYRIAGGDGKGSTATLPKTAKKVVFTFTYDADGESKTSKVRVGGPWAWEGTQSMIMCAENGDDVDYNDAMVQLAFK
jgi:hypothetical protein